MDDYINCEILVSNKKGEISNTYSNMAESLIYYTKCRKPDPKAIWCE